MQKSKNYLSLRIKRQSLKIKLKTKTINIRIVANLKMCVSETLIK